MLINRASPHIYVGGGGGSWPTMKKLDTLFTKKNLRVAFQAVPLLTSTK